jgi:phage terminase Nu1 subunit (DNA packaging protein)
MKSKRNAPEKIESLRQLAKLVNRSAGQVSRWMKDERWPFAKKSPWYPDQVPKILRWVAEHLRETTGGQVGEAAVIPRSRLTELKEKKLEAEIRKLEAQADAAEVDLDRAAGDLLPANDVRLAMSGFALTVKNGLSSLPTQLSIELEGREQFERQEIIERRILEKIGLVADDLRRYGVEFAAAREADAVAVGGTVSSSPERI